MNQPKMTAMPGELENILAQLSVNQIWFLIARNDTATDKDAAEQAGISYAQVRNWPADAKQLIDEALRYMAQDGVVTTLHLRRRLLARAMAVKAAGLKSSNEHIQQSVATEIIEWELGKASQRIDLSGEVNVNYRDELECRLSRLVESESTPRVSEQPEQ